MFHLAHVFIGRFDLQVPLGLVIGGAVAVVAASFLLIYLLPERPQGAAPRPGLLVPKIVVWALQGIALAYLAFLVAVGILGRQTASLNAAALAFWVLTIPLLPILHCFFGGLYEVANPFALLARLLSGGRSARQATGRVLPSVGYWPAMVTLFFLGWFELAVRQVPNSPSALGFLVLFYTAVQVSAGLVFGEDWFRGGDVWQAVSSFASAISPLGLERDAEGFVRLRVGFSPARLIPTGRGREALITFWLAEVLADGVRATPLWQAIATGAGDFTAQLGQVGVFDLKDVSIDTGELVFTWLAFGIFFWGFVRLAAAVAGRRPGEMSRIVSPSLVPIALAYLLAHNLTQLIVIGPLTWAASGVSADAVPALLDHYKAYASPPVIFAVQVGAIVAGHVVAVLMAHARLRVAERDRSIALRADLGWLTAMLVYTGTSLYVLALPITNSA